MPFEIPQPQEEVKVGTYQVYADAMLRGCAVTRPLRRLLCNYDGSSTCAIGAMLVGLGLHPENGENFCELPDSAHAMEMAYVERYGSFIVADNDTGDFTREQIAARIAAL